MSPTHSILLGGPCEISKRQYIHNVPNVKIKFSLLKIKLEGATRVIEGVYTGGNVEGFKDNPVYVVKEYYGYAAWFGGQLDGELRRSRAAWTIHNDTTFDKIFPS